MKTKLLVERVDHMDAEIFWFTVNEVNIHEKMMEHISSLIQYSNESTYVALTILHEIQKTQDLTIELVLDEFRKARLREIVRMVCVN